MSGRLAYALLVTAAVLSAEAEHTPRGPLVSTESWPRAVDLRTWVGDIMRIEGLENATETAQGKALFEWLRLYCRMAVGGMIQAHEGPFAKERYVLDAHKNLFVYGWGYCDTCSRVADAAWKEFKQDPAAAERVVVRNEGGGYHTKYRLRLDGNYGAFDPRYGYYLIETDAANARVLDWPEVGKDQSVLKNKEFRHRSRPFFEYFGNEWEKTLKLLPVFYRDQKAWETAGAPLESVFGDSHYVMGTRFHDMSFRLPKGTTITRFWDNTARAFYRPISERANRELPFLSAGRVYRVNDSMFDGTWVKHDPNYLRAKPYLTTVPRGEGYGPELEGGRTIGQAWGRISYQPDLRDRSVLDALTPDSNLELAPSAPYLRARDASLGGSATFDFYSPYILVDGTAAVRLTGRARMQ
ncbi:MAG TPA: hypothetical protein VES20_02695, partial [Bryobacteraceae bacterium]|nr:hypothetical protein [Bryobacteraceae bacterium]